MSRLCLSLVVFNLCPPPTPLPPLQLQESAYTFHGHSVRSCQVNDIVDVKIKHSRFLVSSRVETNTINIIHVQTLLLHQHDVLQLQVFCPPTSYKAMRGV
jgi:hypothetical protein